MFRLWQPLVLTRVIHCSFIMLVIQTWIFYYSTGKFYILWYKDEIPIKGSKRLDCVCRGEYAVLVIDMLINKSVGMDFFTGGSCLAEEVKTTTGSF